MIKAVIFDCFGVLVTEGWLPFAEKYFGHYTKVRRQATDLLTAVNKGLLGYDDFIREVAKLAGINEALARASIMRNVPNEPLLDYIKTRLKSHYKIGLLSNAGRNRLQQLFTPTQLKLFDDLALSYETGFLKPEPQAYQNAAERLGLEPAECVFVDDQEKRYAGARAVGMQAVLYQDFPQIKRDLEQLLADTKH